MNKTKYVMSGAIYMLSMMAVTPAWSMNRYESGQTSAQISTARLNALLLAEVKKGDCDGVKNLLETAKKQGLNRADYIDAQYPGGWTLIHYAASLGYADVIDLLLKYDFNPNALDTEGQRPLHLAAKDQKTYYASRDYGPYWVARTLFEHWALQNEPDGVGMAPLHLAVKHGNVLFVQAIVDTKRTGNTVEINLPSRSKGETAIHLAARNEDVSMLLTLVEKLGCDINVRNEDKQTALGILNAVIGARSLLDEPVCDPYGRHSAGDCRDLLIRNGGKE